MVPVAKEVYMIGSYPPSKELISYSTSVETAPSGKFYTTSSLKFFAGILARGSYKVHSKISDDDNHLYSDFNWTLEIASSW
jgi:hypothetical protein